MKRSNIRKVKPVLPPDQQKKAKRTDYQRFFKAWTASVSYGASFPCIIGNNKGPEHRSYERLDAVRSISRLRTEAS